MKNITKQQKAEARAYNDTIKNNMSIENKLEILFDEVLDYVNKKIGDDGLKALDKIIVRFTKDDLKKVLVGYSTISNGNFYFKENITKENIKEALKAFKINICISKDDKFVLSIIALRYYSWFYDNLDYTLNQVINAYSENGESLEPKVKELIAKKEANQ